MSDAEDDYFGADNGIDATVADLQRRASGRPGLSSERRHIEREMAKLQARLGELDEAANRFGDEPPVGTVITFQKHFPNSIRTYSYAALRTGPERATGAGWFLTGRDGSQPRTWAWLTDFIGDGPFRVIAPEAGKSSFFNVLFDDRMPSNMVLVVGDRGKAHVGVDPTAASRDALRQAKRSSFERYDADRTERVAAPGEAGYDAATFEATVRHKQHNPVAPFVALLVDDKWRVLDLRGRTLGEQMMSGKSYPGSYADSEDGKRRAEQSASDRNRLLWKRFRNGLVEPPVGARVRSKSNPNLWAVRSVDGWIRRNGIRVQGVKLSWTETRRQLGGDVEPGSAASWL